MLGGGTVKELYELKGEGRSMRGIASDLGISRATVRKYALSPEVPKPKARAKRGSKLDAYAGAPCNFCPARTGRPTPEQLWMCLKDWTIAWQCSTRGAVYRATIFAGCVNRFCRSELLSIRLFWTT